MNPQGVPISWPDLPSWQALAAPLRPVLAMALARLELLPRELPPVVPATEPSGEGLEGIALDPALLGPGTRTPQDQAWADAWPELAPLALDRWRRAAGLVLEGVVLAGMRERLGGALPRRWWTLGAAAEAVDRAAPELGWLWPEAAELLQRPEVGLASAPRRAAWLFRWLRSTGRAVAPGERPELDEASWAAFGAWLEDLSHGPFAPSPVPLGRGAAHLPDAARQEPLSHRRLQLQATAAGAVFSLPTGARALAGGESLDVLVGSLHGGVLDLRAEPLLPLGDWLLVGGTVGERPGAARGIELALSADGHIDLVFADAFAGPPTPALLDMARQLGVSGSGRGRFRVTAAEGPGRGTLVFDELVPASLTVHPRLSGRFALPAEAILGPVHKALEAMVGVPWAFQVEAAGLRLQATLYGAETVLRLERPPVPDTDA